MSFTMKVHVRATLDSSVSATTRAAGGIATRNHDTGGAPTPHVMRVIDFRERARSYTLGNTGTIAGVGAPAPPATPLTGTVTAPLLPAAPA